MVGCTHPVHHSSGTSNSNGLQCAQGVVLRVLGKGLAFNATRCAPYTPYVHGGVRAAVHASAAAAVRLTRTTPSGRSVSALL